MAGWRVRVYSSVCACVPAIYLVDCNRQILASAAIFSCLDTGVRGSLREASEAKQEETEDEEPHNEAEETAASSVWRENRLLLYTSRWRTHTHTHLHAHACAHICGTIQLHSPAKPTNTCHCAQPPGRRACACSCSVQHDHVEQSCA